MPKGTPLYHDFAAMVELVIRERKIALPASRLIWYAHWFGLGGNERHLQYLLGRMVKDGLLVVVEDGRHRYYKNIRR